MNLTDSTLEMFPRQWVYYGIPKQDKETLITIQTKNDQEVHVYHKAGKAPSRSDFDGIKKSSKLKYIIDESELYTLVAVHNPSKDLNATVTIKTDGSGSNSKLLSF